MTDIAPNGGGPRLLVDRELCQGHLRCWQVAPELIEVDDLGYAVTAPDPLDAPQQARARDLVGLCPEGALSVTEPGSET